VTEVWRSGVLEPVEALLDRWRARGESAAIDRLDPAWRSDMGLTDGWFDVLNAIREVTSTVRLRAMKLIP